MDYVTRQFINLTKKLRDDVRKGLSLLHRDLERGVKAIDEQTKRNYQTQKPQLPPPVLRAELQIPEAIKTESKADNQRNHRLQVWLTVGTWLAFTAAFVYAYFALRQWREMVSARHQTQYAVEAAQRSATAAENANTEAETRFAKDQRPYIWFMGALPIPHVPNAKFEANVYYANFGKTPALNVRSIGRIFFGDNARREAHDWIVKMRAGSLDKRDMSVAVIPPGIPADFQKTGYFVTAVSESKPSEPEVKRDLSTDFAFVMVVRIEYSGTNLSQRFSSDICMERLANGNSGFCHNTGDNSIN